MEQHFNDDHRNINPLAESTANYLYACIYCKYNMRQFDEVQKHLAFCHSDELAYACERVAKNESEVSRYQISIIQGRFDKYPCLSTDDSTDAKCVCHLSNDDCQNLRQIYRVVLF